MIKTELCVVDRGSVAEGEVQRQAGTAALPLAAYLDSWPSRGVSKHTLMGPVADILDTLRHEDASPERLLGQAMRTHELAAQWRLSAEAHAELEKGVRSLVALVQPLKPAERQRLLTAVEWEVFYHRRKRQQTYLAERNAAWQAFVRNRYGDDLDVLRRAWEQPDLRDWQRLPSPSSARTTPGQLGQDAQAFYADYRSKRSVPIVEDEEEAN